MTGGHVELFLLSAEDEIVVIAQQYFNARNTSLTLELGLLDLILYLVVSQCRAPEIGSLELADTGRLFSF